MGKPPKAGKGKGGGAGVGGGEGGRSSWGSGGGDGQGQSKGGGKGEKGRRSKENKRLRKRLKAKGKGKGGGAGRERLKREAQKGYAKKKAKEDQKAQYKEQRREERKKKRQAKQIAKAEASGSGSGKGVGAPPKKSSKVFKPSLLDATPWKGPGNSMLRREHFLKAVGSEPAKIPATASEFHPVVQEIHRHTAFLKLRQHLIDSCYKGSLPKYPSMAFERWWLSLQDGAADDAPPTGGDPLLPASAAHQGAALLSDLCGVGFTTSEARKIAQSLADRARQASSSFRAIAQSTAEAPTISTKKRADEVELSSNWPRARARLTHGAYEKLWALHSVQHPEEPEDSNNFEKRALAVALRYEALGGTGFQLALPTTAFEVLHKNFQVCAECFASPFNCWFPWYCSAFIDTDDAFGSLGSFFDFCPKRGAFEVNPPFAPALLAKMREHIHALLAATKQPLSFVVTVAKWEHAELDALEASPYVKATLIVPREEQQWLDGSTARRAPVELLILILQNQAATKDKLMCVTDEKMAKLRASCIGDAKALGPRKADKKAPKSEAADNGTDGSKKSKEQKKPKDWKKGGGRASEGSSNPHTAEISEANSKIGKAKKDKTKGESKGKDKKENNKKRPRDESEDIIEED
mmetsp:Transcript_50274/g.106838  ORF Transcript_50274/g.106838 Transcript_50274/m.106838 type:complete len:637 (-) Transcript_50274:121-2031(-)